MSKSKSPLIPKRTPCERFTRYLSGEDDFSHFVVNHAERCADCQMTLARHLGIQGLRVLGDPNVAES